MNENTNTNNSLEENGEKTYSQADVDKLIEEGRKKAKDEAEREAEKRYSKKQKESERLSKMNEEEKRVYQLEQREQAIAAKEQELALAENKAVATSILVEKGISPNLVNFVVAADADEMNNNIKLLEKEFRACVKAEVEKRIGKHSPRKADNDDTMDKEKFRKLPLTQQQELYNSNPELYKQLIGG